MCLLQLILLNEATLVLVNDAKGLNDVIFGFASKADLSKETFVVERVSRCKKRSDYLISRQPRAAFPDCHSIHTQILTSTALIYSALI